MTKQLKQYEQKYWHIPKFIILPIIATIFFSFLSYLNSKLINWNIIKIAFDCTKDNCNLVPKDLIVCYSIIAEYIFIALTIASLIAIIKNGFNNLKNYNGNGLIGGLTGGLIGSLIEGLIGGLIGGLIRGLIVGLIWEFEDD